MLIGPPRIPTLAPSAPVVSGRPVPAGLKVPSWWREDAAAANLAAAREAIRGIR